MNSNKMFVDLCMNNKKTNEEILIKLMEEVGELSQAYLSYSKANGSEYKGAALQDIHEESVDVMMVVYSFFLKNGGTPELFQNLLKEKTEKWHRVTK